MPENQIAARGGATKWRTIKKPDGTYIHIAVVRKSGKRGGKTVAGRLHHKKGKK